MGELKFVITGTAGVGKSTAIACISDVAPVVTDEETTDELREIKNATTVAFDFGEVFLNDDTVVRIYGTPGQERFRHMWEIIADGALGLIILVDCTRNNPPSDLAMYIENFADLIRETGMVVGLTRTEKIPDFETDRYFAVLEENNILCPVIEIDPRKREDVAMLLDTLMAILEYN